MQKKKNLRKAIVFLHSYHMPFLKGNKLIKNLQCFKNGKLKLFFGHFRL